MGGRFWVMAAAFAFLLLGSGCSSVQRPTVSYKSMSIGDVSASGFTMNVDVDIHNPNAVAIPLANADYSLALAGTNIVRGAKIKPAASVPAEGAATITLPIPVTFQNLLAVAEGIKQGGGNVDYGLDAGLDFDTGLPVIGVQRVPFAHQGTLNVKELLTRNWGTILNGPAARELAQKILGGMFKL